MARTADVEIFLRNLPEDGSPIGNQSLRTILDWDEDRYERAKSALLEEGLISRGKGKFGSVMRILRAPRRRTALQVFISYSHADGAHQGMLKKHLQPLVREGKIAIWTDGEIKPGEDWAREIATALGKADIIMLLVSIDFLNSDYCYNEEMNEAVERHNRGAARVVPVIVRPCQWTVAPFAKLQALPKKDSKVLPVVLFSNEEEAYDSIASSLRTIVDEMITKLSA